MKKRFSTMTGGTMSDGQVRVSGTFTMNGGNISNHDSQYTLLVSSDGKFTVNAGTISGTNISSSVVYAAGHVYVYGGTISGSGQSGCIDSGAPACLHVKGSPAILGGVGGRINIEGELTNDTPIPVIPQGEVTPGSPMTVTDGLANGGDNAPGRFTSGVEGLTWQRMQQANWNCARNRRTGTACRRSYSRAAWWCWIRIIPPPRRTIPSESRRAISV